MTFSFIFYVLCMCYTRCILALDYGKLYEKYELDSSKIEACTQVRSMGKSHAVLLCEENVNCKGVARSDMDGEFKLCETVKEGYDSASVNEGDLWVPLGHDTPPPTYEDGKRYPNKDNFTQFRGQQI